MALTRLNTNIDAHKSSSTEIYGLEVFDGNSDGTIDSLRVTTTNVAGADNITNYENFGQVIKVTGFTFSINSSNLIITYRIKKWQQ